MHSNKEFSLFIELGHVCPAWLNMSRVLLWSLIHRWPASSESSPDRTCRSSSSPTSRSFSPGRMLCWESFQTWETFRTACKLRFILYRANVTLNFLLPSLMNACSAAFWRWTFVLTRLLKEMMANKQMKPRFPQPDSNCVRPLFTHSCFYSVHAVCFYSG